MLTGTPKEPVVAGGKEGKKERKKTGRQKGR
jgi:hypothetical protein